MPVDNVLERNTLNKDTKFLLITKNITAQMKQIDFNNSDFIPHHIQFKSWPRERHLRRLKTKVLVSVLEGTSNCITHAGFCRIKCQTSRVYTLQKSLMMMTVGIVKYSSYKDGRLSRQTVLNFLVTCPLSDYIDFFYRKYVVMRFGVWHSGHTYKSGTKNQ